MKQSLIHLIILATVVAGFGQDFRDRPTDREKVVNRAVSLLNAKATPQQIKDVLQKADKWRQSKSDDDWLRLSDSIHATAKACDARSEVTITTSGGDGATVKYQTLGERKRNEKPTTAKQLTKSRESMYIGLYYIWSERRDQPTSNKDKQYSITNTKDEVALEETK